MADHEIGRRFDVRGVQARIGHSELPGHQDGIGAFVELDVERVRRGLAVDQTVAREGSVRLLLVEEQEIDDVARGLRVAGDKEAGPCFVDVAREYFAVRPKERVIRVVRNNGLTPWRRDTGYQGAGKRLIFR